MPRIVVADEAEFEEFREKDDSRLLLNLICFLGGVMVVWLVVVAILSLQPLPDDPSNGPAPSMYMAGGAR